MLFIATSGNAARAVASFVVSHSIRLSFESSADVEEVFTAFGDPAYWQARLAAFGNGNATLDDLVSESDDTVTVAVTVSLLRDKLPGVFNQLYGGDVRMVRTERWSRSPDGRVSGAVKATLPGTPLSVVGDALLEPTPGGSRLGYTARATARIPLLGSKIESYAVARAGEEIPEIHRFTTAWIADHR